MKMNWRLDMRLMYSFVDMLIRIAWMDAMLGHWHAAEMLIHKRLMTTVLKMVFGTQKLYIVTSLITSLVAQRPTRLRQPSTAPSNSRTLPRSR